MTETVGSVERPSARGLGAAASCARALPLATAAALASWLGTALSLTGIERERAASRGAPPARPG